MSLLLAFFVFVFGSIVGSFLGVLVSRALSSESAMVGRSRCDNCRHPIAWYDNIPILSYLVLSGKCRYCKKAISIQHLAIELITGILFVWWYLVGFAFFRLTQHPLQYIQPLYWLVTGTLLLFIAFIDTKYYLIPDYAVAVSIFITLIYRFILINVGIMNPADFLLALLSGFGLASVFALIIIFTKGRGMGWGDVKLALAIGLIVGWPRIAFAAFAAFVFGAIVGLLLILVGKKKFGQTIPFGPFLILGTFCTLLVGNQIWGWYMKFLF